MPRQRYRDRTPSTLVSRSQELVDIAAAVAAAITAMPRYTCFGTFSFDSTTSTIHFTPSSPPEQPSPPTTNWEMFDEYCGGVSNCHLTFAPDQSWTCQNDLFALDGPPQAIEGMCFLNLGSQAWCYYGTLTIVT